ncbi:uncharacterized protein EV422DRAFT_505524 [Fimicolochytrium jonesii]|uniref:uncharacterized protein n=1 Tax=Fimicolochytrium jonesii TaxID=1396493 RepID=UPI0022FE2A5F|nr:uncharacterized protein EV422DRAFT_505524 [Fimicolochytrium jonesii]KAI8822014.1 hypothetical protein EV422DRAFT_505524 [Fimicolochytrium jonesii]
MSAHEREKPGIPIPSQNAKPSVATATPFSPFQMKGIFSDEVPTVANAETEVAARSPTGDGDDDKPLTTMQYEERGVGDMGRGVDGRGINGSSEPALKTGHTIGNDASNMAHAPSDESNGKVGGGDGVDAKPSVPAAIGDKADDDDDDLPLTHHLAQHTAASKKAAAADPDSDDDAPLHQHAGLFMPTPKSSAVAQDIDDDDVPLHQHAGPTMSAPKSSGVAANVDDDDVPLVVHRLSVMHLASGTDSSDPSSAREDDDDIPLDKHPKVGYQAYRQSTPSIHSLSTNATGHTGSTNRTGSTFYSHDTQQHGYPSFEIVESIVAARLEPLKHHIHYLETQLSNLFSEVHYMREHMRSLGPNVQLGPGRFLSSQEDPAAMLSKKINKVVAELGESTNPQAHARRTELSSGLLAEMPMKITYLDNQRDKTRKNLMVSYDLASERVQCWKCEGKDFVTFTVRPFWLTAECKGWRHENTEIRHRTEPGIRCKKCSDCSECGGSGMLDDKYTCRDCDARGFIHPRPSTAPPPPPTTFSSTSTTTSMPSSLSTTPPSISSFFVSSSTTNPPTPHIGPEGERCSNCITCPTCEGRGITDTPPKASDISTTNKRRTILNENKRRGVAFANGAGVGGGGSRESQPVFPPFDYVEGKDEIDSVVPDFEAGHIPPLPDEEKVKGLPALSTVVTPPSTSAPSIPVAGTSTVAIIAAEVPSVQGTQAAQG